MLDDEDVMPDPDAEDFELEEESVPVPAVERAKLNKQIAAVKFKIAHPEKFNRAKWEVTERMELDRKLLDLETLRGEPKVKAAGKPRLEKRGPSYQLPERRAIMRSTLARNDDGDPIPPDLKELMAHAVKYGSEMVVETAIELGYGHDSCVRLMDHCDRSEAAAYRKQRPLAPAMKFGDSDMRVRVLMGTLETQAA